MWSKVRWNGNWRPIVVLREPEIFLSASRPTQQVTSNGCDQEQEDHR